MVALREKYEMIIIGAGMTGLSTGLAFKKLFPGDDHKVLIVEKQPVAGGCVTTFAREGFRFDTVQIIPDISDILDFLSISIELKKYEPVYARLFLADPIENKVDIYPVASTQEEFSGYLCKEFPSEKERILEFFRYCSAMHAELGHLKTEPAYRDIPGILFHCRKILANSGKTYSQFLEKFGFRDQRLIEVLDIFSSFSGLSGNRCASLLTACAMATTLKGSYRPEKGFIEFPNLLKKEFERRGGTLMMNTTVGQILVKDGHAVGVELENGSILKSDIVVSTADTSVTTGKMVGAEVLENLDKSYSRKALKAIMSPSAFAIHLGLSDELDLKTLGFNCGYNVLTTGRKTHEKMFDAWEKGHLLQSDEEFHLAVISPSAMTGGKNNLVIHVVPAPAEPWITLRNENYGEYLQKKETVADFYIRKVEEYMIPGLRKHILFRDISSPATYARYIGSPTGSNYDMMPVPGNFGKNRLRTRTPVKGLFLPKFSHGIWPSLQAGLQVVDMISGGSIMNGSSSLH